MRWTHEVTLYHISSQIQTIYAAHGRKWCHMDDTTPHHAFKYTASIYCMRGRMLTAVQSFLTLGHWAQNVASERPSERKKVTNEGTCISFYESLQSKTNIAAALARKFKHCNCFGGWNALNNTEPSAFKHVAIMLTNFESSRKALVRCNKRVMRKMRTKRKTLIKEMIVLSSCPQIRLSAFSTTPQPRAPMSNVLQML